ncbi:MAG: MotA/TolQ/ExbB proton channel family protein [Thermoguttaceae bacterium]|jgi:hypothetical protein
MKRILTGLAGSAVLWGLVATFAFYYSLNRGYIDNETLLRYATGHPVEYITIGMFLIGLCDLSFKLFSTRRERGTLKRGLLFPPKTSEKEPLSKVDDYLSAIDKARAVRGDSSYLERLSNALNFLKLGGAPDDLDLELRRLDDDAYDDRDGDYGLARTFIWAIPILGFLGTVLGITVALGSLDLTQIETTSEKLADGLKVAFDTTALALSLVFLLYFLQFFSRRQDAAVARLVARMADAELKGRFYDENAALLAADSLDPSSRLLIQTLSDALEENTRRQAETLTRSIRGMATEFGDALDQRLVEGSGAWVRTLADAQNRFVEGSVKPSLEELARRAKRFDSLEDKVAQEIEALRQTLRACADVVAIEDRLSSSLEELAQVNAFDKTLANLNATICMLNAKLAAPTTTPSLEEARRALQRSETLAALRALDEKADQETPETYPLKPDVANADDEERDAPTEVFPLEAPGAASSDVDENASESASHKNAPVETTRSRALLGKKKRSA